MCVPAVFVRKQFVATVLMEITLFELVKRLKVHQPAVGTRSVVPEVQHGFTLQCVLVGNFVIEKACERYEVCARTTVAATTHARGTAAVLGSVSVHYG